MLGIRCDFPDEHGDELKRAYKKRSLQYHPDKLGGWEPWSLSIKCQELQRLRKIPHRALEALLRLFSELPIPIRFCWIQKRGGPLMKVPCHNQSPRLFVWEDEGRRTNGLSGNCRWSLCLLRGADFPRKVQHDGAEGETHKEEIEKKYFPEPLPHCQLCQILCFALPPCPLNFRKGLTLHRSAILILTDVRPPMESEHAKLKTCPLIMIWKIREIRKHGLGDWGLAPFAACSARSFMHNLSTSLK